MKVKISLASSYSERKEEKEELNSNGTHWLAGKKIICNLK
uniref:Uncharacterized protein n=1 Tax=Arundo donax TaxID=35708 RepID=A0A0A9F811_ARUDO